MDMKNVVVLVLLLVLLSISNSSSASSTNYQNTPESTTKTQQQTYYYKTYIKNSCNTTTYPSICYKNLNRYALSIQADPLKLCNTSLSLALKAARSAASTVSKILKSNNLTAQAKAVVHDCYGNLKDSVEEMQDSIYEMGNLYDDSDKGFHLSNIKTWVSAAITNYNTCSDGCEEMKKNVDGDLRNQITNLVSNLDRMTSNALYFINHLTY